MAVSIVDQNTTFNNQSYKVKIFLDNGTQQFQINPNAIVSLGFEETLADWVTRGTMTIYYSFEAMEIAPQPGELGQSPTYSFRNDGNDILNVQITPIINPDASPGANANANLTLDPIHWKLNYQFSIYDTEDIDLPPGAQNAPSAVTKAKKFYFHDYWYQLMLTDYMEFSTSLTTRGSEQIASYPISSIPDTARAVPTGYAMQEIIKKSLIEHAGLPNSILGSEDNWEEGSSRIFYTAPAPCSASESLAHVYERHVSSLSTKDFINDFAILTKERGPGENDIGQLILRPVSKFFEKAGSSEPGDYQIEHFYVQEYAPENIPPGVIRVPTAARNDMQKDTKLGAYSLISSYRFVDISPDTNAQKFRTKSVHSVDFKNRALYVEYTQSKAETARDFIQQKYISQVAKTGNSNDLFLVTLDSRKRQRNIEPVFSLYGGAEPDDLIDRQVDGLQKLLRTGLFLNSCINFRVLGSTNRETGRFIAIDRISGIPDSPFNDKFYGQWFVINVRHIFEAGIYYNEITAVKTHRFKGVGGTFTDTI